MLGFITSLFSGGAVTAIERIASEAIETEKETAEAKSLFVKTLDPNGLMRRQISRNTTQLYAFYLISMVVLLFMMAFNIGDASGAKVALDGMQGLFLPITGAWTAIVSASFGVNMSNNWKDKNLGK